MKTFCPNCEKETECEFTAELYECKECGEDFARYIVDRKAPDEKMQEDALLANDTSTVVKRELSDAEIEEMGARSAEEKEKHPHLKRNDYCWSAFKTSWAAPAVNKRYLVMLENDWICCATYYLRVGGGYWKNDSGQEINTVVCWRSLDELR